MKYSAISAALFLVFFVQNGCEAKVSSKHRSGSGYSPSATGPPSIHPPGYSPSATGPPSIHPPGYSPSAIGPPCIHSPSIHPPSIHPPGYSPSVFGPPIFAPPGFVRHFYLHDGATTASTSAYLWEPITFFVFEQSASTGYSWEVNKQRSSSSLHYEPKVDVESAPLPVGGSTLKSFRVHCYEPGTHMFLLEYARHLSLTRLRGGPRGKTMSVTVSCRNWLSIFQPKDKKKKIYDDEEDDLYEEDEYHYDEEREDEDDRKDEDDEEDYDYHDEKDREDGDDRNDEDDEEDYDYHDDKDREDEDDRKYEEEDAEEERKEKVTTKKAAKKAAKKTAKKNTQAKKV